jgi:cyclase
MAASVEGLREALKKVSPESLPLLKNFYYRLPTITLSQRLTLYLGKHSFQLINLPGHTAYEVAVYIPEEGVIFTSDNVFGKVFPGLQQALPYEWLDSLEKIRKIGARIVVPGHGCVCDGNYIPEMRDFIQEWVDAVTDAINRGLSLEEAQATIDFTKRYPAEPGLPFTVQDSQRRNIARLYEVLKK